MLWGGRWEGGSCLGTHVRIKDFKIKKILKKKERKKKTKKKKKVKWNQTAWIIGKLNHHFLVKIFL